MTCRCVCVCFVPYDVHAAKLESESCICKSDCQIRQDVIDLAIYYETIQPSAREPNPTRKNWPEADREGRLLAVESSGWASCGTGNPRQVNA